MLRRVHKVGLSPISSFLAALVFFCIPLIGQARAQVAATPVDLGPGQSQAVLMREQPALAPAPTPAWEEEQGVEAYFRNWFRRVALAQSEQPAWIAALVAPPPFLVEQMRYDQYIEHLGNDASLQNFGVNKGLQLIPDTTEEIDINIPQYEQRQNRTPASGFGDWQVALFKQRLLSANANNGNYVLSAWVSATAPTGSSQFTNHVWFVSPNIGGGKGFGDFDVQGTFGPSIPTSRAHLYGTSLVSNLVFQYRFEKVIWPEVEFNWTDWVSGTQHGGRNQVLMTVGTLLGKFTIHNRLGVAVGVGYQFPLTPSYRTEPALLPTYQRNWIATLRMPF